MTKKQREQVVELLRCAADDDGYESILGLSDARRHLDHQWGSDIERIAWMARVAAFDAEDQFADIEDEEYRYRLLEAAQRVEEGWTP